MQTYFIQLEVDEQWLDAIANLTSEIYDGEMCKWISIQANDGGEE
jgi:hypothetical protein